MLGRRAMGAFRTVFFVAVLAVGCGGRATISGAASGSGASLSGGSGGVSTGTVGSSGGSVAVSGVASGGSGNAAGGCNAGCLCFSTPETCPTGCVPGHDSGGAFFCGSPCVSDSDCSGGVASIPLACGFQVADGCSAKGTCRPVLMGGLCAPHPACTCAGTTDPWATCNFGDGSVHEPIAYGGPCTDGGQESDAGASAGPPPSCAGAPGTINCGPGGSGTESCCTSLEVTGGTYYRTYTNDGTGPTGEADPATVSSFRLDKYLVTVGRFRQFVRAAVPIPKARYWWSRRPGRASTRT